ncbi:hypothetical protein LPJ66_003193 [Kickxella alabastrina]|uniref:Uncharacterized protein n=1 Tax=Kickxella alabastrina TaxID=61397 RepID=A0ACC1INC5_9FUNG|nr:hypothetical protein LPJ66_003193 [Kickxella alabastrina]
MSDAPKEVPPSAGASEDVTTLNVDPNTLTVADLYDKEKFDLETMDNRLVFQLLQCSPEGLSQSEAEARITKVKYHTNVLILPMSCPILSCHL